MNKIIVKVLVILGFLSTCVSAALACTLPPNWDRVRDVPSKSVVDEIAVIRGKVESVGVKLAEGKSCLTVYYSDVERYAGQADGPYQLAICPRVGDFDQFLKLATKQNSGSNRLMGIFQGADVVAALTKQRLNFDTARNWEPPSGYFRPMRIDCMGLPQINLGEIPKDKKSQYLSALKKTVQNEWFTE